LELLDLDLDSESCSFSSLGLALEASGLGLNLDLAVAGLDTSLAAWIFQSFFLGSCSGKDWNPRMTRTMLQSLENTRMLLN